MASWADFEAADPGLAADVRAAFAIRKHCTMATLRADGAPRISGTEVEFADGQVYLGMPPASRKGLDLVRDPRIAIHSPTRDPLPDGRWDGEAKLSGVAVPVADFRWRIDLSSAVFTGLTEDRQQLLIRLWRPARGTQTMRSG